MHLKMNFSLPSRQTDQSELCSLLLLLTEPRLRRMDRRRGQTPRAALEWGWVAICTFDLLSVTHGQMDATSRNPSFWADKFLKRFHSPQPPFSPLCVHIPRIYVFKLCSFKWFIQWPTNVRCRLVAVTEKPDVFQQHSPVYTQTGKIKFRKKLCWLRITWLNDFSSAQVSLGFCPLTLCVWVIHGDLVSGFTTQVIRTCRSSAVSVVSSGLGFAFISVLRLWSFRVKSATAFLSPTEPTAVSLNNAFA